MQIGLDKAQEAYDNASFITNETFEHIFAGPLKRTWQTLVAILCSIQDIFYAKVHEEIMEIGNDGLFDGWKQAGAKFGSGKTNFDAMRDGLTESLLTQASLDALNGVKQMFTLMDNDETGLAVGHSPVIELAAHATGLDMNGFQLKENEYIIFEEDNDGKITAKLPIP
jgi:broad specificity phosphatase PhoE